MERKALNLDTPLLEIILEMSEGNFGAATVLGKLCKINPLVLCRLDEMNIRGAQIWIAYKDCCQENLELLMELLKKKDQRLVDGINICAVKYNIDAKAVANYEQHPNLAVLNQKDKEKLKTMNMPDFSQGLKKDSTTEKGL